MAAKQGVTNIDTRQELAELVSLLEFEIELLNKCQKSQSIQNSTWDEITYRRNNITSANISVDI